MNFFFVFLSFSVDFSKTIENIIFKNIPRRTRHSKRKSREYTHMYRYCGEGANVLFYLKSKQLVGFFCLDCLEDKQIIIIKHKSGKTSSFFFSSAKCRSFVPSTQVFECTHTYTLSYILALILFSSIHNYSSRQSARRKKKRQQN